MKLLNLIDFYFLASTNFYNSISLHYFIKQSQIYRRVASTVQRTFPLFLFLKHFSKHAVLQEDTLCTWVGLLHPVQAFLSTWKPTLLCPLHCFRMELLKTGRGKNSCNYTSRFLFQSFRLRSTYCVINFSFIWRNLGKYYSRK